MKNKEGFISMTLVYTFLIVFLFLMASILSTYTKKSDYLEKIDSKIKEEVKLDKSPLTGEVNTSWKDSCTVGSTALGCKILNDNTIYADTGINFKAKSSPANGQGLYTNNQLEDGKSMYFRGGSFCAYTNYLTEDSGSNCTNAGGTFTNSKCSLDTNRATCQSKGFTYYDLKNNVTFAGRSWKIIKIDEDGSIRMIYAGTDRITSPKFNTTSGDNAYMGYMFGTIPSTTYANAHTNTNISVVKTSSENWYTSYLTSYASYFADPGFCNDRTITTGLGYGTNNTNYGPYTRNYQDSSASPLLNCPNPDRDLFTLSSNTKGNKALTYPIGLPTVDELRYGGLVFWAGTPATRNYPNYLLLSIAGYWTMSPYYVLSSAVYMFGTDGVGELYYYNVSTTKEYRPVIALKPTVVVSSGTGTYDNPYVVN